MPYLYTLRGTSIHADRIWRPRIRAHHQQHSAAPEDEGTDRRADRHDYDSESGQMAAVRVRLWIYHIKELAENKIFSTHKSYLK